MNAFRGPLTFALILILIVLAFASTRCAPGSPPIIVPFPPSPTAHWTFPPSPTLTRESATVEPPPSETPTFAPITPGRSLLTPTPGTFPPPLLPVTGSPNNDNAALVAMTLFAIAGVLIGALMLRESFANSTEEE